MEVYRLIFYKIYHNNHHLKILSPRQDYPSLSNLKLSYKTIFIFGLFISKIRTHLQQIINK